MTFKPSYLSLSKKSLKEKVSRAYQILSSCQLCPRNCGADRTRGEKGVCQAGLKPKVSSFHPHFGEERCLVGAHGSGIIFFSHCNLKCVFCQNYEISQLAQGKEVEIKNLVKIMLHLQKIGCHNINLATPTIWVPQILKALSEAIPKGLILPIVYNCGGYESVKTLELLDGVIDIYMPDIKYGNNQAGKYSAVSDYWDIAQKAILEMHRQVGDLQFNEDGLATRGLLVRHLVLPKNIADTEKVMDFLAQKVSRNTFVNLMDQYYPCYKASSYPPLNRRITPKEFNAALASVEKAGLWRFD